MIDIQHFAEKDIKNQESASLRRAIRKYNKRIEEHKNKIENPSQYVPNWNDYSEKQKEGLIKHWKKEIYNFDESINNRIEELKKRGEQSE